MELKLAAYGTICEPQIFVINGIKASYQDFGEKYDTSPDEKKPNICCNMEFKPKAPTQEVLAKYQITLAEYAYVCRQLQACISFGTCRFCA
jgi:hypothetical protein